MACSSCVVDPGDSKFAGVGKFSCYQRVRNPVVQPLEYDLPESAIAQVPAEPRSAARLLVALGSGEAQHHVVADLPDLLEPGDLLVVNETRVLPARLALQKET